MVSRHDGVDVQGKWLAQVLRDWMAYYAVPMSGSEISAFRHGLRPRSYEDIPIRRLSGVRQEGRADQADPMVWGFGAQNRA